MMPNSVIYEPYEGDAVPANAIIGKGNQFVWDDLRAPATALRLDSAATRYSFDSTNVGVLFNDDARYTEEQITVLFQMPHRWKLNSEVRLHFHWIQNQNASPNWLGAYRYYGNNQCCPSTWVEVAAITPEFTYTSGDLSQVNRIANFTPANLDLSGMVEIKFWRDTANLSGKFAGADPYVGQALLKEIDLHYKIDGTGSLYEREKGF
jgi:hypothetical protein